MRMCRYNTNLNARRQRRILYVSSTLILSYISKEHKFVCRLNVAERGTNGPVDRSGLLCFKSSSRNADFPCPGAAAQTSRCRESGLEPNWPATIASKATSNPSSRPVNWSGDLSRSCDAKYEHIVILLLVTHSCCFGETVTTRVSDSPIFITQKEHLDACRLWCTYLLIK